MAENKKIEQPTLDLQQLLDSVLEDSPTDVEFMGKKRTLRWLKNGAVRKFSHVSVAEKDDSKRAVKLCAIVLLNNVWKIRFLYWIVWRWWYYVKDVDAVELLRVLDVAKKNSIGSILTAYHISDRDDGLDDDEEEERVKSFPSRTCWGAAYSLSEKFSFLFASRFGIRAYDYWWGYTAAQITLMVADQPLTVYPKDKKRDKDGNIKHTLKEMDDLYDRWAAKREKEGSLIGQKIDLNEYMKNKV